MIGQTARKFYNEVRSPSDGVTFLTRLAIPTDPRARQLHSWVWGKLPRVDLSHVFPGSEEIEVKMLNALQRSTGTSLNLEELVNLIIIAKATNSKQILEIGTYDGNTALNLAANSPRDSKVITIDLAPDFQGDLALPTPGRFSNITDRGGVGSQYQGTEYETKISQIFGDSATLNWSEIVTQPIDLAFIDGCHYREYVESDTDHALRHLSASGVIVWHDYGYVKDVSDYVDELAERLPVHAIAGTRLALCRPSDRR
jgi:predicted O-methyltransferase YrrM